MFRAADLTPPTCAVLQLAVAEWSKLSPEQKKQWKEEYFAAHPELLATSNQEDDGHEGEPESHIWSWVSDDIVPFLPSGCPFSDVLRQLRRVIAPALVRSSLTM